MSRASSFIAAAFAACIGCSIAATAQPAPQTVCTITVNSSDEKEAFRRHLPADRYRVRRARRARSARLARIGARRRAFAAMSWSSRVTTTAVTTPGGNEFFSEHVDAREFLPVDEMERVACSEPDDGLFSQLKEVYLFGCNTLNPQPLRSDPAEIARIAGAVGSRSGRSRAACARAGAPAMPTAVAIGCGTSSGTCRRSMAFRPSRRSARWRRRISDRYFQAGGARDVATGRAGAKVLAYFPGRSLTLTRGMADGDADAGFRRSSVSSSTTGCPPLQKVEALHRLLSRDMAEVRIVPRSAGTLRCVADRDGARRRPMLRKRSTESRATARRRRVSAVPPRSGTGRQSARD